MIASILAYAPMHEHYSEVKTHSRRQVPRNIQVCLAGNRAWKKIDRLDRGAQSRGRHTRRDEELTSK